jgi:integrase
MGRHSKRRIPQLAYTKMRDIGWHVNYRDPVSGMPRRLRFPTESREAAEGLYRNWLAEHLKGAPHRNGRSKAKPTVKELVRASANVLDGSMVLIASTYLAFEQARTRKEGELRRSGTISPTMLAARRYHVQAFLRFMNRRHGAGSVGRLSVLDLSMQDVEAYNREIADAGKSDVLVAHRMAAVKAIIDRSGRPEHGEQILSWNWNSRDKFRGKAGTPRTLPNLKQLKAVLNASDTRKKAIVWMAIGLGFGQGDLTAVRVGQIDEQGYDLRRGKTGLDRFGETPPGVWKHLKEYLAGHPRKLGELLFTTENDQPLSHGNTDTVHLWWRRLRESMNELGKTLGGFYVLRHLGATEFGSRPSCSISGMRRWLGHSASSSIADVYMRPVAPEHREIVEFVRKQLLHP